MATLKELFEQATNKKAESEVQMAVSGSNRKYYRLQSGNESLVGVVGTSKEENTAFIEMTKHFTRKGLPVPKFILSSEDNLLYLQEDLGDTLLFDYVKKGRQTRLFSSNEKAMLHRVMEILPKFQVIGAQDFDFSICYPQPKFNKRSVLWDLNYFKYCFLKPGGLDFQENVLEDDFEKLADALLAVPSESFMYRDFQSRNVMIKDNEPFFIDYQGGRKGPVFYDVASFLWQAKAQYGEELREELLQTYLQSLGKYMDFDEDEFRSNLKLFVLFRLLQVLGAYGFRGYFEKKPHFLQSIPYAMENLRELMAVSDFSAFPYLLRVLRDLSELKQYKEVELDRPLVVTIYSFSYKKGIPNDASGNGGGYVFDCRAVNNPGKYERFYNLTGLDEPVIQFLEEDGEILKFMRNSLSLVEASVKRYIERKFTNLMICYGCTGGQHRSVYVSQKVAEHLNQKFGIEVHLIHREQNIEQTFPGK
ncbi:MAG: phosphotransferase [Porphyromonadaceae bacterium]|jgi:aminoglycoside/choline kinase family phosphotransferase|nr:phosphotransferase [Porphyromonadaceae bacterium]